FEITVVSIDGTAKYDGKDHTIEGFETLEFTIDGVNFTVEGLEASATGKNVGTYTNVITGTAIVRDENGNDVTKQFTVNEVEGELEITKRSVTLTSATDEKVYDGTPLTNDTVTVTGDGFAEGEGAGYDVTGSQLNVGESDNEFTYELNEGTLAENYDITVVFGTLKVTPVTDKVTVTITEHNGTEKYDGTEKTVTGYDVEIDNELYTEEDFTFSGDDTVKGTNAGKYDMELKPEDFENISINFTNVEFVIVDGQLEITKRQVTLTSADDKKEYDATPLTNDTVTVTGDGFAEGEGASYDVTGSQTLVGSSDNEFTYTLNEGTLADNYDITVVFGTLTVTANTTAHIIVTAEDADKVYDGTPLTEDGFKVEGLEEFEGLTVEAVIEGSITDVGTEDNTVVSIKIYDKDGNDVTDMFDPATIEFIKGTLTVNKRKVVIKSASDEKVYDGTPLTNPEVTIEGDGFVEGEIKEVRAVGTITYVGSTANTIEIVGNDGSLIENVLSFFGLKKNASEYKAENYDITVEEGTLTVTEPSDDSAVVTKSHKGDDFKEGDVVTFRIEVTNIYNEAKDITLVEIEGVTLAKDSFKNVKPGETVKTTATYTITDEDVVNGKFVNTVEAVFDDKTYEAEDTATTADARPAISLVKTATSKPANGDAYVKGEVIEYEIKVTNTGDATLYDVKTTDDLTGDVWTKDVLAIGESIVYKTSYTVTDEDVANGKVVNTAVAVAHDLAGTVVTSIGVRTSAEDDITLYTGLFGGSLAAVFGLYIFLKKRREEEEYA
ncbi:MAG: hypothetical protein II602_00880, partial [Erysipelotrichales bacterium]|nr:hypothetical protein [Erysipelotrichales bacterium]